MDALLWMHCCGNLWHNSNNITPTIHLVGRGGGKGRGEGKLRVNVVKLRMTLEPKTGLLVPSPPLLGFQEMTNIASD